MQFCSLANRLLIIGLVSLAPITETEVLATPAANEVTRISVTLFVDDKTTSDPLLSMAALLGLTRTCAYYEQTFNVEFHIESTRSWIADSSLSIGDLSRSLNSYYDTVQTAWSEPLSLDRLG